LRNEAKLDRGTARNEPTAELGHAKNEAAGDPPDSENKPTVDPHVQQLDSQAAIEARINPGEERMEIKTRIHQGDFADRGDGHEGIERISQDIVPAAASQTTRPIAR